MIVPLAAVLGGCGTSRFTDTKRTATEQLLDFRALAGKKVYLDATRFRTALDAEYLDSSLRQHLAASGALLADDKNQADYIVEGRVGSVGTDKHEMLFGIPETRIPSIVPAIAGIPSNIPEVPLVKKTEQRAVMKLGLFAYNRESGRPLWQSGLVPVESKASDIWVLGAGPFQRGSIYKGMNFAGDRLNIPLITPGESRGDEFSQLVVGQEAFFADPDREAALASAEKPNEKPIEKPPDKPAEKPDAKQTAANAKSGAEPAPKSQVVPASHQAAPSPESKTNAPSRSGQPSPKAAEAAPRMPPFADAPKAPWPDTLDREMPSGPF
jgi:hypothetical protein